MTTTRSSVRASQTFSESCDFRESRVIPDSKITKRRKNSKRTPPPPDESVVQESILDENTFRAEEPRESINSSIREMLACSQPGGLGSVEEQTTFDNTSSHYESLSKEQSSDLDDGEWEGLEKIKAAFGGVFSQMVKDCKKSKDAKALGYCRSALASYCSYAYETCDKTI